MSSGGGHGGGDFELPGFSGLHKWMEGSNDVGGFIIPGWGIIILFLVAILFYGANAPTQNALNWQWVLMSGPLWMPILFGRFAMLRFLQMRRSRYNFQNPGILLEIKIPRDIRKSPAAMEALLSHIHINPGEGTWLKKYWWGRTRPWWSLEFASIGGEVHFYIWTRTNMRRLIEASFYAQYPEVELIEAVDYSRMRDPSERPYKMFACEYMFSKPDPYPIKTYIDFGIDKPGLKPEEQVDPIAGMLEVLGSIGPNEEIWTQLIFRVSKGEKFRGAKNPATGKARSWREWGAEIVKDLRKKQYDIAIELDGDGGSKFPNPTEVSKHIIEKIERNVGKPGFDVGIRSIYSAPEENYGNMNPFVANIFKGFNTDLMNSIGPAPFWSEKFNDYPWEDIGGFRQKIENREAVEFYRYRSYFHPPYRGPWLIMSAEEFASIYHIPTAGVKTPGLPRIPSTTAAAPANLPH